MCSKSTTSVSGPASTSPDKASPNLGVLWAWTCDNIFSVKPLSSCSGDSYPVIIASSAAAYILGTLVSNALSIALLALLIACAALIMSAALICLHQQNQGKDMKSFGIDSAPRPDQYQGKMNAAAAPFRAAPFNPTMQAPQAPSMEHLNSQNSQIIYHSQAGSMDLAHKAIRSMRAQGSKPKLVAYSCFLNACAKSGQVKQAEQCLTYMNEDGVELNTVCYCTLINVYALAGDLDKAEHYFQTLGSAGGEVAPNTSAYNSLIKACSRVRQIERAQFWFDHMKSAGVEPNVITFTTLVNACAKARDAEGADKWLKVMLEHKVEANLMTYNSVIDAWAKVGNTDRAEQCFQNLRKDNLVPDIVTYNSLINTYSLAGDVDGAARWLDQMVTDGLEPDSVSFSTCIGACVKKGDMAAAKAWLAEMFHRGVELSAVNYSSLIHAGVKIGDFDFAEYLLTYNTSKGITTEPITYRAFIHAAAKANQSERAMQWLEEMVHAHGFDFLTTDDIFGPVISSFCNSQNSKAVLDWISKMREWNIPISQPIYSKTIKTLQRTGQSKLARNIRDIAAEMNKMNNPAPTFAANNGGRVGAMSCPWA